MEIWRFLHSFFFRCVFCWKTNSTNNFLHLYCSEVCWFFLKTISTEIFFHSELRLLHSNRISLFIQTDYFSLLRILHSNFDLFSSIPNRYVLFHSEWRFIQSNFWNSKHIHSGNSSININCVAVFINIFFWRNLQSEPEWRNIYSGLKNYIYIYTVEIWEKHFYFFFAYLFVTQFVHVKVHFKGFVYWMYEIILVYILDTWSSYVLTIYICICCWKFLIWPLARFGLFFSCSAFFTRKMQQSPIFLLSLIFCQKKLEQGSTLQHGETAIENGDVSSPFLVGLFQIS